MVKFYNGVESENLDFLHAMGRFCETLSSKSSSENISIPRPIHSLSGNTFEILDQCSICFSNPHHPIAVRIFTWVPGITLNAHGSSVNLLSEVGRAIGIAKKSLFEFDSSAFHRYHAWDLSRFADVSQYISYIDDPRTQVQVSEVHNTFVNYLLPISDSFSKSIVLGLFSIYFPLIHLGDCNDANVIVNPDTHHVVGLIDFGDSVYTWSIADLAIALAYSSLSFPENPLPGMCALISSYCSECGPLSEFELDHIQVTYLSIVRLSTV